MIKYRTANKNDAKKIAHLHARNWQLNYKGIFTDEYLNDKVIDDRLAIWQKRFEKPNPNQHILLAENKYELIGFACTFLNDHPINGALLDNLHVSTKYKGKGTGKELMKRSAQWVHENDPTSHYHLLVLEKNIPAINFYEKLGGKQQELFSEELPDGNMGRVFRYVWTDLKILLDQ